MEKMAKKILFIFLMICLVTNFLSAKEWYQGGNLHQSTFITWRSASYENKLATCADWLFSMKEWKEYISSGGSLENLKTKSKRLLNGLNEFCIDNDDVNHMKVNEIAALIYVMANDLQPYSK